MRVALDTRGLQQALRNSPWGGLGGPGTYALGLVRALIRRNDDTIYYLLTDHGPVPPRLLDVAASSDRVLLYDIGFPARLTRLNRGRATIAYGLIESPLLDRQIRRLRPDVVHLLDQPAPQLKIRPVLITLHDLAGFAAAAKSNTKGRGLSGVLLHQRLRLDHHRVQRSAVTADLALCVSESTARDAERWIGMSRSRLIVSYPGVDTETFRPGPADGTPFSGQKYFLHVGILRDHKNPEGLLWAFREATSTVQEVHLVCTGPYHVSPSVADKVVMLSRAIGIADRVHVVDDCGDGTLARLYRGAIGLVFPSFYEGFGFPVAEALACGTPCVTSNRSSLPEVGGDLAVYVNPEDYRSIASGMRRVLDDHELTKLVRARGPGWAARFSLRTTADTVFQQYVNLTSERSNRLRGASAGASVHCES